MDTAQKTTLERLQQANNILVTVSRNPSVDQLAACLGITLLLNKLGKHATAVFSGEVPQTIDFLEPDKTLEKTTDSLRDFIIALDKAKADKLRYKVEDKVVKIFITPYRTSIDQTDLDFSQGDFNVEVVLALGIHEREDLDQAIVAHGRILHDATVIGVNTHVAGGLGTIEWTDPQASSLSEMLVGLADLLKPGALDNQMATAFLTGIVAETDRFSNEKTSSNTMNTSAKLIAAGANQQLIAAQLSQPTALVPDRASDQPPPELAASDQLPELPAADQAEDGALQISHDEASNDDSPDPHDSPDPVEPVYDAGHFVLPPVNTDQSEPEVTPEPTDKPNDESSRLITEPPTLGGTLTANSRPEAFDPVTDPMSVASKDEPLLSHNSPATPDTPSDSGPPPLPPQADPPASGSQPADETLADIEAAVDSPHVNADIEAADSPPVTAAEQPAAAPRDHGQPPDPQDARQAVAKAVNLSSEPPLQPIEALNAQAVDLEIDHKDIEAIAANGAATETPPANNIDIDPATGEIRFKHDDQSPPSPPPSVPPPMVPPLPADANNDFLAPL